MAGMSQFQRSMTIQPKKRARAAARAKPPRAMRIVRGIEKRRLPFASSKGFRITDLLSVVRVVRELLPEPRERVALSRREGVGGYSRSPGQGGEGLAPQGLAFDHLPL